MSIKCLFGFHEYSLTGKEITVEVHGSTGSKLTRDVYTCSRCSKKRYVRTDGNAAVNDKNFTCIRLVDVKNGSVSKKLLYLTCL